MQPNAIVRSVAALVAKQAAKSGIRLVTRAGEELPEIMIDGEQIKQALLNLVINAMQAMPDGGSLDLTAALQGNAVILRVADSGPGIPAAIRNRLFNPFVTTKKGGTGLPPDSCRTPRRA